MTTACCIYPQPLGSHAGNPYAFHQFRRLRRGLVAGSLSSRSSSIGQNLLNGGTYFATNQLGAKAELGYDTAILTLAYSTVNPGFAIQTPWSANPFYTGAQIQNFQRAGEQALSVGASYVFKHFGLPGVAASVFYFNGWTAAPAAGAPLVESEWNFALEWRPEWKPLHGLWFRARYGTNAVWQAGNRTITDELRLIVNYDVKLY